MFGWGKNNVEKEIEDKAISNDNKKTIEDSLTAFSFISKTVIEKKDNLADEETFARTRLLLCIRLLGRRQFWTVALQVLSRLQGEQR